jgi:diguanylate cyclase (GGDEF)-like protein/PAS domain S-box-containing protein
MFGVVYNCLVNQHDLRLVALALLICAVASFTALSVLRHVRATNGSMRYLWLAVAATSTGFGIWATHFVAMLAYVPGVASAYNVNLTILSLVAAILLTGAGFAVALARRLPDARALGGAIVGGGIAAMHYTGMAAFEVAAYVRWDPTLVAVSIAAGATLGSFALVLGLRNHALFHPITGALLLTVAIASHHFIAMGAAEVIPDASIVIPASALPNSSLAIGVAVATLAILTLTFLALSLDIHERRRAEIESDRMRGLANAAVEGLLVVVGGSIVTVNQSLASLYGGSTEAVARLPVADLLPKIGPEIANGGGPNEAVETELRCADGTTMPVEVIQHAVDYAGSPGIAVAVRDLRDRRRAERRIQFLAHHDQLTQLPNRASFNDRLDGEIERHKLTGRTLSVLCLDLDRFKEVNDLFGQATGDAVLQQVARCVTLVLGEGQVMARLGGDEFGVIAPGLNNAALAGRLAEDILQAAKRENEAANDAVPLAMSIGIASFPTDASDRTSLLSRADTALYRAKTGGRGTYRFFEASMEVQLHERRMVERDLLPAIARNEFRLVYQPQTRIDTLEIVGFEALLRWNHTGHGPISPAIFVPIAEETGAILQLGEWVLREACREAASWDRSLSVATNVSAIQLHSPNFASLVHEVLFSSGLSPERLELEITETALIRDLNRALTTLRQLKALGVRIAMDDFGTGYSSLANLRAFRFDKLKIDRSFISAVDRNQQSAAIVRAVLGLGRGLDLPVIAEGVETRAELQFLAAESCDQAQGYLIGKPEPIEAFASVTSGDRVVALKKSSATAA